VFQSELVPPVQVKVVPDIVCVSLSVARYQP
jgi:hypothetical protein